MQNWLPKLQSRERWYVEHFSFDIKVDNLYKDGKFTRYDVVLLEWWNLYHYYDYDYNLLPRAKDGGLNIGLIRCMRAIDAYYKAGEADKKAAGIVTNNDNNDNDDLPIEV